MKRLHCLSLFFFSCLLYTVAGAQTVFDSVRTVVSKQRISAALYIYDEQVKRKDSIYSISSLQQLEKIAEELNDASLHSFSISLLADQYARIRGFNSYSTQLHESAVAMAQRTGDEMMMGICLYRMGGYYYSFKNYPLAYEYLLKADNYFQKLGYNDVPDIDKILFFIGGIYYETGNYAKSETYLRQIQELGSVTNYLRKQSLNTLAMIYKNQKDTAKALLYFQKTLGEAVRQKDSAWIGISYSNMGNQYLAMGDDEKAFPLLQKAFQLCLDHHLPEEAFSDLLSIAKIDIKKGRLKEAAATIAKAMGIPGSPFGWNERKILYETQAAFYQENQEPRKAAEALALLMQTKDSIAALRDRQDYEKVLLRVEMEKHAADIGKLETTANASRILRNAVIIALVLLLLVLLLLYGRYRLKAKNTSAILQAQKTMAEEKLKHARQLLQDFMQNNRQKNELIEKFSAELERLKANLTGNPAYEERLNSFEKLVQSTILTDEEWLNFRSLFEKVYKDFFIRLAQKLPGLSVIETRLLSLVKLGMNSREIANMTGMPPEEVDQLKTSVKKKVHPVEDGITLEDLVKAI